jgi:ArsR family transcriptional regulator
MDEKHAANALSALGHEARLGIFRLLVRAGPNGLKVGDVGRLAGLPLSTLTHHLNALVQAGLVTQTRQGREVINQANHAAMRDVFAFIEDKCCQGVGVDETDAA